MNIFTENYYRLGWTLGYIRFKGKIKGIKFKNEFIKWIKDYRKYDEKYHQASLF